MKSIRPIRITGKVVVQPVVITSVREITTLIMIETDKGYEEFYFSTPILSQKNIGAQIIRRQTSHIALSSIGDYVELDVETESGFYTGKIICFKNITRNLGSVLPDKYYEKCWNF